MLAFLPVTGVMLSGCMKQTEGVEEIHYGRDACTMCGMIISDPHFANEVRGGPNAELFKFDDIGDAVNWLQAKGWKDEDIKEFWVMDSINGSEWLEARNSFFMTGAMSPMNHGFAAIREAKDGAVSFAEMQRRVLARSQSDNCIQPSAGHA